MYRLPLAPYRVLDLGPTDAAAYAARLLGDAGAEVIAVERPPAKERTAGFRQLNRNKLGCTLDFGTPQGAALLLRLASRCDVVVHGFDAAKQERLGMSYDAFHVARGDVIVASVGGASAAAPTLGDVVAGTAASAAVCAALLHHRDSGEGQHVEVDARDCALSFRGVSGAVQLPSPDAVLADQHLRERRFFEPVSSMSGVEEMPALPWRFSFTPCHVRLPAPQPGEHNRYVLAGLLGLSEAEIADLARDGIIRASTTGWST
jgi:crotonobetainyl-CoA:carnitine CoA-transferase CaiB-like acyl-CoA transferase